MLDPKFLDLPGVVHDQPDVFETPDNPDQSPTSDYEDEEPENDCIEKLHLSSKQSFNKFKGKYLIGNVDFSDNITKKHRNGYEATSGIWELAGDGEKESPIQKYHRLECEMNELIEEIAVLQRDSAISSDEKKSYEAVGDVVNSAKKVLTSLNVEQVLGKESSGNPSKDVEELLTQIRSKKDAKLADIAGSSTKEKEYAIRIEKLENRLHELESAIGVKQDKLNRLSSAFGTSSVMEAVQQLSTKAALLQPAQLDTIETRITTLVTKMDAIAEKSAATNQDTVRDQKTMELYDIAKKTEPILQVLPDMLNRMQALETLHKHATNFSQLISELEITQANIAMGLANNKGILQEVEEQFKKNNENVSKEISKLDERVKKVVDSKK